MQRFLLAALALGLGAALPATAQPVRLPPPDNAGTLTFTTENDLFGGGTDRYYTNGVLLSWRGARRFAPRPSHVLSAGAGVVVLPEAAWLGVCRPD